MTKKLNKIMHVDDDPVMRLMTNKALDRAQLDFNIISYNSAIDVIENIDKFNPDLLLVDFIMPIMNGENLIINIRKNGGINYNCPVIFISGKEDITFNEKEKLQPLIGIIKKPFVASTIGQDILNMWNNFLNK